MRSMQHLGRESKGFTLVCVSALQPAVFPSHPTTRLCRACELVSVIAESLCVVVGCFFRKWASRRVSRFYISASLDKALGGMGWLEEELGQMESAPHFHLSPLSPPMLFDWLWLVFPFFLTTETFFSLVWAKLSC